MRPFVVRADRAFAASAAAWIAATVTLAPAPGCGQDLPPVAGDFVRVPPSSEDSSAPPIALDGSTIVPSCNLGPEGGVCACLDQPLLGDIPNLYFVLDRSGSMAESNKWTTIQVVLEKLVVDLGPRARIGAAVFPNPSDDGCEAGVQVMSTRQGDAPAGTPGPTATALIDVLGRISAAGGTPTAATLSALLPTLTALPGKTYVILATDGGPNCDATLTCTVDQCTDNIEDDLGCPPGGPPNCCADTTSGENLACLDGQATLDAIAALAAAGIPVYVVGVPGSAPYAALLDQMAAAGTTARGQEPQYYAVDTADQAAFQGALTQVAAKITGTCTLDLGNAPPDPSLVNVFLDESVVPQQGPNGWTLSGETVTLLGTTCQSILDGDVIDVRVVAGCPTVLQ